MQMTRRGLLAASAAGMVLAACSRQSGGDLSTILDQLSTDYLREAPEYATSLGVDEARAGGPFRDRLSDASREGQRRVLQISENALATLQRLDRAALPAPDAVTYDVVVTALENNIAASRFEFGGGAQTPYVVTQLTGSYTGIPDFLASQHQVASREDADAYLSRLAAYARVLDQESARIPEEAGMGVIPPSFCISRRDAAGKEVGAIGQLRDFAAIAPGQNVLVTSFAQKLAQAEAIAESDRTDLTQRAERIVRDEVLPAYQRQIDALNGILPQATADAGAWKLPNGAELYATALRAYTTTSMQPDEMHQMGLDLIEQFTAEMDTILRSQGMTRGSVAERVQALSRRPDQIYPSTDAGRARLLADLNAQVEAGSVRRAGAGRTRDQAGAGLHRGWRTGRVLPGGRARWLAPRGLLHQPARSGQRMA